jgi:DNA-binding GntR family transcriptional regulator
VSQPFATVAESEVDYLDRWQVIRRVLRDDIIAGTLRPGEVLSEAQLAQRFRVSRGPVRTALQDLARVGLVVGGASRRRVRVARFERKDIDELYEVQMGIERTAVRSVAGRVTDDDVDRLYELLEQLGAAQASGDSARLIDADLAFHEHIFRLSDNRRLFQLWLQVSEQVRCVIGITHRSSPHIVWSHFNRPIADAIAAGNPDAAEQAVITCFLTAHAGVIAAAPFGPQQR